MKRIKIISIILTLIITASIIFSGCGHLKDHKYSLLKESYQSAYTIEEHKQNLYQLALWDSRSDSTDAEVYIMYSFNDAPEYFFVEATFTDYDGTIEYDCVHGCIYNDEYYMYEHVHWEQTDQSDSDYIGLNPYKAAGVPEESKKYYGEYGIFAWENADGQIEGYDVVSDRHPSGKKSFYLLNSIKIYSEEEIEKFKQNRFIYRYNRIIDEDSTDDRTGAYVSFWGY